MALVAHETFTFAMQSCKLNTGSKNKFALPRFPNNNLIIFFPVACNTHTHTHTHLASKMNSACNAYTPAHNHFKVRATIVAF